MKNTFFSILQIQSTTRIYKKLDETELLLYCPANLCVVHVNMRTYEHTVIKLDESFKYINFLPLYFWAHHDLLLTTSDQFFRIDLDKRNITQISQAVESTASSHYLFYECWKKYHTANIINFYLKEMIIAVEENNQINIDFFDPKHHQHKKPVTYPDVDVQEVIYNNGTLLFIKNNAIEIITTEGKKGKLGIEKPYKFCTARFVKNSRYKFVALYCDTSAAKHDQLRLFEIEHKDSKIID